MASGVTSASPPCPQCCVQYTEPDLVNIARHASRPDLFLQPTLLAIAVCNISQVSCTLHRGPSSQASLDTQAETAQRETWGVQADNLGGKWELLGDEGGLYWVLTSVEPCVLLIYTLAIKYALEEN